MKLRLTTTDGVVIFGMRGSGKTYASVQLVKEIEKKTKVVILDPTDVYQQYKNEFDSKRVAVISVDVLDEQRIESVLGWAFKNKAFVVLDEASEFPFEKYGSIRALVMRARNWGCGYLGITRAPADLKKAWIANASYSLIFRIYELNALDYLCHNYDVKPDEIRTLKEHYFILARGETVIREREGGNPVYFRF
jgi:DNA helicase HerA-like ATPase